MTEESTEIYHDGLTSAGTRLITAKQLKGALGYLRSKNVYIQSMEAFDVMDGKEFPNFELSILGLDGPDNWENHRDMDRSFNLAATKVDLAENSDCDVLFKLWLDEV